MSPASMLQGCIAPGMPFLCFMHRACRQLINVQPDASLMRQHALLLCALQLFSCVDRLVVGAIYVDLWQLSSASQLDVLSVTCNP